MPKQGEGGEQEVTIAVLHDESVSCVLPVLFRLGLDFYVSVAGREKRK